jgi:hypothetical protein
MLHQRPSRLNRSEVHHVSYYLDTEGDPEHPYSGGSSVWRAAVRRERLSGLHEQAVADVPIRFEGLPGEYLQVDWGEIRHFPFTQQKPVTRYFLACRLKYSRWTWVMFTDNMRHEALFRGLVACSNALGVCPGCSCSTT